MKKILSKMTLEELWELFPVLLTDHNKKWREWYEEEAASLKSAFPRDIPVNIHHIGSTAVSEIWAKPIIDILIEVNNNDKQRIAKSIIDNSYILMNEDKRSMDFNKGYTPKGFAERVFHIHLRTKGDHDEIYFRDYLNTNPEVAKEYEELKLKLWKKHEHNRDAYTDAKTDFIKKYTEMAKKLLYTGTANDNDALNNENSGSINQHNNDLLANLNKIHTTELGRERIKKNLQLNDIDVVAWCKEKIKTSDYINRRGKNWYVYVENSIITVNAHSFTVITAHKEK